MDRFLRGLLGLAKKFGFRWQVATRQQSPAGIQADIVVVGSVPQGTAVLRSGARPATAIYVTGELGGAAAELGRLQREDRRARGICGRLFLEISRALVIGGRMLGLPWGGGCGSAAWPRR